ncbi:MAG: DUF1653 domain-containing protein [Nanoarchaeota archaeon]
MKIKKGKYRHFKGKIYEVIGTAIHTETNKELVIYKESGKEKNPEKIWARPVEMFLETIKRPEYNYKGQRFVYIDK